MRAIMRRRGLGALTAALICLAVTAATASAAGPISLSLPQSDAFSILGRSCGGIQEQVYATGFAPNGYPTGDVYMQTRCGGSGRGGGYHYTTYTAWATATWDWFGDTRSFAPAAGGGGSTTFSAEDTHGDRIYNVGTSAFLETGEPPLLAPAAPSGVTATVVSTEVVEEQPPVLSFQVGWTPAGETAGLITSSTVTATPVGSSAPVLTTTVSGSASSASLGPLQAHTKYLITVTNTDAEGTSEASAPIEEDSSGTEPPPSAESCEQNSGTIKLTPGLGATPQIQSVTVKGKLIGCNGAADIEEGSYVAHLITSEQLSCSALTSPLGEAATGSLSVKWIPSGKSTGTFSVPLTEWSEVPIGGTFEGGPLEAPLSVTGGSVFESFKGGASCGVPAPGKTTAPPVKSATFTGTAVELG